MKCSTAVHGLMLMKKSIGRTVLLAALLHHVAAAAQSPAAPRAAAPVAAPSSAPERASTVPPVGYVIGPEDVLNIVFWRDKDLSAEVIVRPDGRISLPLLNEFEAAGLTTAELREQLVAAADRYVQDPIVTVIVKQINSRRVFITGMVNKPGPYSLMSATTVVQLIAMAGGLQDYADREKVVVMRTENGRAVSYRFNYKQVIDGKNLKQNIELKPGDTVIVP
jgi:polysaccharide export outer membrane protein